MDNITIIKEGDLFYVKQGNKSAQKLDYAEMIGLVSTLSMPDERPCLHWMEETYEPKDGDFVFDSNFAFNYIYIFRSKSDKGTCNYYAWCSPSKPIIRENSHCYKRNPRLATEDEKQLLLDTLHINGKDWDAENKEIIPYKWVLKKDDRYWYVNTCGDVTYTVCTENYYDKKRYELGNCFRTKEEAQKMINKYKELFINKL